MTQHDHLDKKYKASLLPEFCGCVIYHQYVSYATYLFLLPGYGNFDEIMRVLVYDSC